MSELFDRKITRRIREVFDNHEEPVDPKAWADMESRLNKPQLSKHSFVLKGTAIAAIIIVGILLFRPFQNRIELLNIEDELYKELLETSLANSPIKSELELDHKRATSDLVKEGRTLSYKQHSDESKIRIPPNLRSKATLSEKLKEKSQKSLIISSEKKLRKLSPNFQGLNVEDKKKIALTGIVNKYKSNLSLNVFSKNDILGDVEKGNRLKLGVTISSLYNYTSIKTRSEFNYSGGFEAQIFLTRRLNFNTGLLFSKQFFSRPLGSDNTYAYKSSSEYLSGVENNISGNNQYRLIGLDIPLNLNYQYKKFSFTAGISSFVFLHEELVSKTSSPFVLNEYSLGNLNNATMKDGAVIQSVKQPPFESMNFLSILNLSVGYHIQLNNKLFVVEPYLKHSLNEITQYNLQLGSLGLQLKYNF